MSCFASDYHLRFQISKSRQLDNISLTTIKDKRLWNRYVNPKQKINLKNNNHLNSNQKAANVRIEKSDQMKLKESLW